MINAKGYHRWKSPTDLRCTVCGTKATRRLVRGIATYDTPCIPPSFVWVYVYEVLEPGRPLAVDLTIPPCTPRQEVSHEQ